jgi:hypothetical protein
VDEENVSEEHSWLKAPAVPVAVAAAVGVALYTLRP